MAEENNDIISSEEYPLLCGVNSPNDLKKLTVDQLPELCDEIRKYMIEVLSKNPGHFASSMGAVEIAVAVHYVFNTPYDKLVWDVGHQAYGHKILTGRRDAFRNLRTKGGISGFPNPKESEYDSFIAGHASNSISAALGMALASSIQKESRRRNVVAVIGDASISGGLAFEGLNNTSSNKNNLLIILNDNDMAIDENVGALNSYLTQLTTTKSYNNIRYAIYKGLRKLRLVDENNKGSILRLNNSLKSFLTKQQNIFEGLNIRYFGPFDGNDVVRLVKVLNDIKDYDGPRILHLRTRKGKGYAPAEKNPACWHAPGKFEPETGKSVSTPKSGEPIRFQDVFGHTILDLAEHNEKIVGITAAMSGGTSLNFMMEKIPDRTFDVGISEGHAVTFAAGLASSGLLPYCCIYSTFLQRAYDQLIHDVALQNLPVTFCIDRGGLVGEDGATHQGAFDLAYLRTVPGMIVASPFDEHYLRNLLYTSQKINHGPFAIRYPRGKGRLADWENPYQLVEIGKGRKLSNGERIAILSIGTIGNEAQDAVKRLKDEGIEVAHYDMIFLKPIDEAILREVVDKYQYIVTLEEGTINGGLGSAVVDWLADNHISRDVTRLGVPDKFISHASVKEQFEACGIDSANICRTIKKILEK